MLEPFKASEPLTLGVELELQLLSRVDYDLSPGAEDILAVLGRTTHPGEIKPELTQSMIEISTGIHTRHDALLAELGSIRTALSDAARKLNIAVSGGGTHPFQHWAHRRIFDTERFHYISELYGYLAKQFTIFGQHVHVGCPSSDEALFLLHCLSRYIPQLIALTASSPYVQGVDTGFSSARLNSVFAFPLSGRAPFLTSWQDFEKFFDKMTATGVVSGMKDFYWDIRPKPEFGTIEVRVCDTPLTVEHAADIACYIQALARMLSIDRAYRPEEDDYLVYNFNRFQACRFGLDGTFVDPKTRQHRSIREDILITLDSVRPHADALEAMVACDHIEERAKEGLSDAQWCRDSLAELGCFHELAKAQSALWMGD
ncbi:MAG: glutamate--cysteine ligase [Betaproteobacteria bacterium]|nr:glutamate--cysteine ligase [Betaproteobacteria bacterium]